MTSLRNESASERRAALIPYLSLHLMGAALAVVVFYWNIVSPWSTAALMYLSFVLLTLELSMRRRKQSLQVILDTLPSQVAILGSGGKIIATNKAWNELVERFGLKQGDDNDACVFEFLTRFVGRENENDARVGQISADLRHVIQDKAKHFDVEFPVGLNGHKAWISLKAVNFLDDRLSRVALVIDDITTIKEAEFSLRAARDASDAVNRTKTEFVGKVCHEIRTPMSALLGYADLLAEELQRPEQIQAIETVKQSGDYVLDLVDDILDLAQIEANRMEVLKEYCCPAAILADVLELLKVQADAKGLSLELEFDGSVPEFIQTDSKRVKQIFVNLVGNAIKFTHTGGVRVVTRLLHLNSDEPKLQFDIVDSGIGIEQHELHRLFQPYEQLGNGNNDGSRSFAVRGNGLGLPITKQICGLLGADLRVRSELNQGSTFSVILPAGSLEGVRMLESPKQITDANSPCGLPRRNSEQVKRTPTGSVDCRVLLVEDCPDSRRLTAFLMRIAGAQVTVAVDGQQAIAESAAAIAENQPFDLILLDMHLPLVYGYEAVGVIRMDGFTGPIIAVTANAMRGEKERCLATGCDDFLLKPVSQSRVGELVQTYRRGGQAKNSSRSLESSILGTR